MRLMGVPVRTTNRSCSQLLGINGRDDGPQITTCSREGINKISLSQIDGRAFSFGVRIAKRRTVQQVLNMVPKEGDGERFDDTLACVYRCIGGGNVTDNADSDSDLEVVADSITVNLRCPMSGSRMKTAGRFKPCIHKGCFGLETFVELNQRSRKWQCPICLKNYSLENIIIDPYFSRITSMMNNCGEDITETDVKPSDSWHAKSEGECRDLARWHLPDGSLCAATEVEIKRGSDISKSIKQDYISEGHTGLKLGIKKNQNGCWQLSKHETNFQNFMPKSSSATASYKDGEDPSVNQDGGTDFDFSLNNNNAHELDSISLNFDGIPLAPAKDANVIVLSDSDEEDNVIMAPPTDDTIIPSFGEFRTNGNEFIPFTNVDSGDYEMPLWPLPTYPQAGANFQLFGMDIDEPDALVLVQHSSLPQLNGYGSNGIIGATFQAQENDTEVNGSLVDNPLAYDDNDPSLQIFLPSPPADPPWSDLNDHTEMTNGVGLDNWISLSLGGDVGGGKVDNASSNGLNSKQPFTSKENDTASLLLSVNGDKGQKATPSS